MKSERAAYTGLIFREVYEIGVACSGLFHDISNGKIKLDLHMPLFNFECDFWWILAIIDTLPDYTIISKFALKGILIGFVMSVAVEIYNYKYSPNGSHTSLIEKIWNIVFAGLRGAVICATGMIAGAIASSVICQFLLAMNAPYVVIAVFTITLGVALACIIGRLLVYIFEKYPITNFS